MKFLKILGLLTLFFVLGCQSSQNLEKAEILSAEYSTLSHSEFEKGYEVFLELNLLGTDLKVKSLVLNQKLFPIQSVENSNPEKISVQEYFPVQSKMIQNFVPPLTDKRRDGIIFELNGEEIYQEIKFKLK
jgi:hypothetical protein